MSSKHGMREVVRVVVGVSVVGCLVALTFLGALHAPKPNDVELAIVAPTSEAEQLRAQLTNAGGDAFVVTTVGDPDEAKQAILDREIDAAFAPSSRASTLLVAGAGGAIAKSNLTELFRDVTAGSGGELVVDDLRPLPAEDRAGLSPFLLIASILIPSLLIGVALSLAVPKASARERLYGSLAAGVALGLLNSAVAEWLGALQGHYWALAGVAALTSVAISAPIIALHRLFGVAGIGLGGLMFLVFGMPTTGAAIGPKYIPDVFQLFTTTFPAGEAIPVIRNVAYFNSVDIGLNLALLSCWAAAGAVVLILSRKPCSLRPEIQVDRDGSSAPRLARP